VLALGANPSAAETARAQPFHVRVYGADAPVAVQEVAFDARRHGACALAALHGALSFRPAACDDLLFAAAAPPRRDVVKEDKGAVCVRAQGAGIVCVCVDINH